MSPMDIVYAPTSQRVARSMIGSGAYLFNSEQFFTWKSGIKAPVYTDCRVLMAAPGARSLVKKALGSAVLSQYGTPDYIVGVAEAGIHWSALVADELHCRHAFVRKQAKGHGVGKLVAGMPSDVDRHHPATAVLVDDLVASGGSLVRAGDALREEAGLQVLGVVSIVNWNFHSMRDSFREIGLKATALVSYAELLQAALDTGMIDDASCNELLRFYLNPLAHEWSAEFIGSNLTKRGEAAR